MSAITKSKECRILEAVCKQTSLGERGESGRIGSFHIFFEVYELFYFVFVSFTIALIFLITKLPSQSHSSPEHSGALL
jgi:hypothetical protein